MKILLSRTDNIGDVILTLPMAGLIKKYYPTCKIYFLGKFYTKDIIDRCKFVDEFLNWDEIQKNTSAIDEFKKLNIDVIIHVFPNKKIALLAKQAKIKIRIGTNRRFYHLLTCNKLINLTRKNSHTHEALLNMKLLNPLKIKPLSSIELISDYYGMNDDNNKTLSDKKNKFNLILHPKSKGSAREWSPENYIKLCQLLPKDKFNIFISGTKEEEKEIQEKIVSHCPNVKSVVGSFSLKEFIQFIDKCDGLIACSTGPLHIAAALGKKTIGLYPPIKNMEPNRWGAIGKWSTNLVEYYDKKLNKKKCSLAKCDKNKKCVCINTITAEDVLNIISKWKKN